MAGRGAKVPTLRGRRVLAALTQRELAERAGVSVSVVSQLEAHPDTRGADFPTIRKLAQALGVEPAELLRGAGTAGE